MEEPYYIINSVVRTVNIIEYLGQVGEASVAEVGAYLQVNKSTAHRFLASMKYTGFLDQNLENQKYRLSLRVFGIGQSVLARLDVRDIAKPFMVSLAERTGETINLGTFDKGEIIYIEKCLSKNTLRMDTQLGGRDPLYCTALGKAILAYSDEATIEDYLKSVKMEAKTDKTITSTKALRDEINSIKDKGYAIDDEEIIIGLRCVAVPIFDQQNAVIAAISISIPTIRINAGNFEGYKNDLIFAAREISNKLGANK